MTSLATQLVGSSPEDGRQVLIIDDSAVARAVMSRMIDASDSFATAGCVSTVAAAHAFLARHRVDVIILDLNMPGTDGLAALPGLIEAGRGARVLVVSAAAGQGASASIRALALGAADTLGKPEGRSLDRTFADTLIECLERLGAPRPAAFMPMPAIVPTAPVAGVAPGKDRAAFDLVAIGASTGGIHALSRILRQLPWELSTPILVTQHLPASFMPYFAAQLAVLAGRPCQVADDYLRIKPRNLYVAPGDAHLRCVRLLDGDVTLRLLRTRAHSGCMPSVDPMLASAADVFGERLLAVVLSGMGRDGAEGARTARAKGAMVVVQDGPSSVIWGMPGAVVAAGDADAVLDPEAIGALITGQRRP